MNEQAIQRDRWLRSAREDLAYARVAATAGHHAPACFHSQQAAEKAAKNPNGLESGTPGEAFGAQQSGRALAAAEAIVAAADASG